MANQSDFYGNTPLSGLCCRDEFPPGSADIVHLLLELGADPNPLHLRGGKKLALELYKHKENTEAAKALGWLYVHLCETSPGWDKRRSQGIRQIVRQADKQPEEFQGFLEVATKAYALCFGFDYNHESPDFHHCFGKLMAQSAHKRHWAQQHANTSWYTFDYCRDIRDMLTDISTRLLLPQLLLTTRLYKNEKFLRDFPIAHATRKLLPVAADLIYRDKTVEGVLGVLKNWNDRHPEFPSELNPLAASGAWHHLVYDRKNKDFVVPEGAAQGMRVVCLTDSNALKEESLRLKHSAEDLIHEGLNGSAHFFSIHDRAGKPVSTFVLRRIPVGKRYEDFISVPGLFSEIAAKLHMEQHRAYENASPSEEAVAAYQAFKHAIETTRLSVDLENSGETPESKAAKAGIPPVLLQIGDHISAEMIDRRFTHYAKARGVAYVPGKDTFRACETHLISGGAAVAEDGQHKRTVAFRDLPAAESFRAGGAQEGIKGVIRAIYPTLATQLERSDTTPELPREIRLI